MAKADGAAAADGMDSEEEAPGAVEAAAEVVDSPAAVDLSEAAVRAEAGNFQL